MAPRWDRLNVDKHWVDKIDFTRQQAEEDPYNYPASELGGNLEGQAFWTYGVAAGYYLQDNSDAARSWGARLIYLVVEYFFGGWRQHMPDNPQRPQDKESEYYAKGGGNWMTPYRTAMAFAVALGDWDAVGRLSEHPSEEKWDAGLWPQEKPWLLLLAEYFRDGTRQCYKNKLASIREGRDRAPKVCGECLDNIVKNNIDEIDQRFSDQMNYYLKNQKQRNEMEYKLALDGTILYHLARREGHEIAMDSFMRDHLIII